MTRRGRPPHPDVLTPREWDVLTLVRDGLINQEIADRLGISRDAVKYHVSEILSKLHLPSREEAARWQPEPPAATVLRPAWASALAPLAALFRRLSWSVAARVAGGTVVAASVAGLGLLLWGVLQTDEGEGDDSVDASRTPAGSASAGTSPTPDDGAVPLTVGQAFPLGNYALILELGCTQCDGGTLGFARLYADGGGVILEPIFDPAALGYSTRPVTDPRQPDGMGKEDPYITGFASAPDASEMWVSLCVRESCGGGIDAWLPGSDTVLFRSSDGGASWQEVSHETDSSFVIAMAEPGRGVIVGILDESGPTRFAVRSEAGTSDLPHPVQDAWPLATVAGKTVWRAGNSLLLDDQVLLSLPGEQAAIAVTEITTSEEPRLAVTLQEGGQFEMVIVDTAGVVERRFAYDAFAVAAVDAGKGYLFGNAMVPGRAAGRTPAFGDTDLLPAAFDLSTGTIRPVEELALASGANLLSRNSVMAVQMGPFAIVTGTGACLDIRSEPGETQPKLTTSPVAETADAAAGEVLACVADGVLMLIVDSDRDGPDWMNVRTPGGVFGFASTDHLEVVAK